tara:strand:- start:44 stop:205 length:162 start_codon:yes stop_codon:yes gene_type:complete
MPFASDKQKTYLAINKPDVYKKFKKDMKSGGKLIDNSGQKFIQKLYSGGKIKI